MNIIVIIIIIINIIEPAAVQQKKGIVCEPIPRKEKRVENSNIKSKFLHECV